MLRLFKRLQAVEKALQEIQDARYKIELEDGTTKLVQPSDAVLVYAPYIRKVQIGPCAENMTMLILLVAAEMGHPNYRAIEFYDHTGANITRQMQQAFRDRGLDRR